MSMEQTEVPSKNVFLLFEVWEGEEYVSNDTEVLVQVVSSVERGLGEARKALKSYKDWCGQPKRWILLEAVVGTSGVEVARWKPEDLEKRKNK